MQNAPLQLGKHRIDKPCFQEGCWGGGEMWSTLALCAPRPLSRKEFSLPGRDVFPLSVGLCRSLCWEQPAALGRAAPSPCAPPGTPHTTPPCAIRVPAPPDALTQPGGAVRGRGLLLPPPAPGRADPAGPPRALGCSGDPWPPRCCVLRWWLRLCLAALLLESNSESSPPCGLNVWRRAGGCVGSVTQPPAPRACGAVAPYPCSPDPHLADSRNPALL